MKPSAYVSISVSARPHHRPTTLHALDSSEKNPCAAPTSRARCNHVAASLSLCRARRMWAAEKNPCAEHSNIIIISKARLSGGAWSEVRVDAREEHRSRASSAHIRQ